MALAWLSILVRSLALAVSVQGQPGFISIDCGIANDFTYLEQNNITYISDSQFINTGVNKNVRITPSNLKFSELFRTVRSFPNGIRNCYNLGSVVNKGNKYLIRAYFLYGDYDGKNSTPVFDVYLGVDYMGTVASTVGFYTEIITIASMNFISVCLVNTGRGTPFISALELRPLNSSIYGVVNESQSLYLWSRFDIGRSIYKDDIRYPKDPFDLIWRTKEDASWISFGTSQNVTYKDKAIEPLSTVMMTAVRPLNNSDALYYSWANASSWKFHVYLHFAELELLGPNMTREFTVCCGINSCHNSPIRPKYLVTTTIEYPLPFTGQYNYSCSIKKTPTSTLPPILNAIETFIIWQPSKTTTREEDGILDGNPDLCVPGSCSRHSNKRKITIPIAASVASVVFLSILLIILRRFKWRKEDPVVKPNKAGDLFSSEKRRFTYAQVITMTNNFKRSIGKGGFGTVYHGQMLDGTQVAVKMLSQQSVKLLSHTCQGPDEFQNEVQLLMRIHHRNLVPFIGYCQEGECTALIYEYMAQGNLGSHLLGTNGCTKALNWGQRLRIALDIAQGLEYLHTGCKPAIIHRDMKTANILLNERFEAKIGDFGLSKVLFKDDEQTHVSTLVKGTPGYLDPEYFHSNNLTQKSDVYGFGVVLLDGNPDLCAPGSCSRHSSKRKITILIAASVASVVILLILLIILRRFKWRKEDPVVKPKEAGDSAKRQFTYAEVITMTNNFRRAIGKGGFGTVYHGHMPDGTQVAVKVQLLMRVHHRNLVPFIGYCQEGDGTALIFEYMAQGNLGSHLLGANRYTKALNWGQRLRIALDIAQG
ncbi:hypothetical protein AAC387_Pa03g4473 [Persea americana]